MTSICIIHIILWIYRLFIEHKDTVLRTVFYIFLSPWRHTQSVRIAAVCNAEEELDVIGGACLQNAVGGAVSNGIDWKPPEHWEMIGDSSGKLETGSNLSSHSSSVPSSALSSPHATVSRPAASSSASSRPLLGGANKTLQRWFGIISPFNSDNHL